MAAPPGRAPGPGRGGNRGALAHNQGRGGRGGRGGGGQNPGPYGNPNNPNSLSGQAHTIANAQTVGPITELAGQIARNNQQGQAAQGKTFGYYMQLAQAAQNGLSSQQGIASGLNSQLSGIQNDTQARLAGFGQQAAGGALGQMGQNGLDGGGLANVNAETARQQGIGALNGGVFRSAGATQGANYSSNAASNLGTYALRGQERIGDIGRAAQLANVPLNSKMAGLAASKGALYGVALGKLKQQDFANNVTLKGLGLKASSLALTQQNNLANQSLKSQAINTTLRGQDLTQMRSDRQFQLDQKKFGFQQAKNSYMRSHGLGPYRPGRGTGTGPGGIKPLTTVQNNHLLGTLDRLENAITAIQQQGIKNRAGKVINAHPTEADIRRALGGVDPSGGVLTQAAYELNGWGFITRATAQQLHHMGIRGGYFRGAPIRIHAAPKPKQGVLGGNLFGIGV